jgi:uncharacterized protein YcbX
MDPEYWLEDALKSQESNPTMKDVINMSKQRLYAAYGSNLNLVQMAARCPEAKPVGVAEMEGYELLFRGGRHSAVATVEPKANSVVPVLIWALKSKNEAALDRCEDFPELYTKRNVDVQLDGKPVTAMIYVMTPGHMFGTPSGYYLDVIAEGYRSAGFDTTVLTAAVERSAERMRQEYAEWERAWAQDRSAGRRGSFDLKWR